MLNTFKKTTDFCIEGPDACEKEGCCFPRASTYLHLTFTSPASLTHLALPRLAFPPPWPYLIMKQSVLVANCLWFARSSLGYLWYEWALCSAGVSDQCAGVFLFLHISLQ